MIGTAISCGDLTVAFAVPFNRLMELRSWDNRGWQTAGPQGIYHSVYLDEIVCCTWIDVHGRADHHPVSTKPYWFTALNRRDNAYLSSDR